MAEIERNKEHINEESKKSSNVIKIYKGFVDIKVYLVTILEEN